MPKLCGRHILKPPGKKCHLKMVSLLLKSSLHLERPRSELVHLSLPLFALTNLSGPSELEMKPTTHSGLPRAFLIILIFIWHTTYLRENSK